MTPASLAPGIGLSGPVPFETLGEVAVQPVSCQAFMKRPLNADEQAALVGVVQGLQQVYRIDGPAMPYVTTPVFPDGAAVPDGFDVVAGSVDHALWLALLAAKPELVSPVRDTLGGKNTGVPPLLNVGVAPSVSVPSLFEDVGSPVSRALVWELFTPGDQPGEPPYVSLDIADDSTSGLSRAALSDW